MVGKIMTLRGISDHQSFALFHPFYYNAVSLNILSHLNAYKCDMKTYVTLPIILLKKYIDTTQFLIGA